MESRTVELAFSSEAPVERFYGYEILDHSPGACDLSRANDGGALLLDHNRTAQIGVIEKADVGPDRKGRATVRFSKSPLAQEILQDVQDGIRKHVSVGYSISEFTLRDSKDGVDTYLATKWTVKEVSIVAIPADPTVGVGRSEENIPNQMKKNQILRDAAATDGGGGSATVTPPAPPASTANVTEAIRADRGQIAEIFELGKVFNLEREAQDHVVAGKDLTAFRQLVLEKKKAKPVTEAEQTGVIGMSDKDIGRYSITKAIREMASDRALTGLEKEASAEFGRRFAGGRQAKGFWVPFDVQQRALNASTATAGGFTVGSTLQTGSMIELLRNRMALDKVNPTYLSGLVGNVAIPRVTGGATAYWLPESGAVTASQQTFGQIGLTPHKLVANSSFTKDLLNQSSIGIEGFIRNDLMKTLALKRDLAGISGSGNAGEPIGVMNATGINTLTFGAAATWAKVIQFETEIAADSADGGSMAYITTAATRGKWKGAVKVAGQAHFLWEGNEVNGYPAFVSQQVPSDRVIFGDFSNLIIADWAGLDVVVDPYSRADYAEIKVITTMWCDFAVRHPEGFCVSSDSGAQ